MYVPHIFKRTQKLRGKENTIRLQSNSAPSLVVNETLHIPTSFCRARIEITWRSGLRLLRRYRKIRCGTG